MSTSSILSPSAVLTAKTFVNASPHTGDGFIEGLDWLVTKLNSSLALRAKVDSADSATHSETTNTSA